MPIINHETRLRIAVRLADDNFSEEINAVTKELRAAIIDGLEKEVIPPEVMETFKKFPEYFVTNESLSLSSYDYTKFLPKEWGKSRNYYGHLAFECVLPITNEKITKWLKRLPEESQIANLLRNFYKLEMERYFMEKRLKCIMTANRYTDKKLQSEFPEAYKIYMDIITAGRGDDASEKSGIANNLCDSVENIRSMLKTNRNVEKGV